MKRESLILIIANIAQEFNDLTAEHFKERLKKAHLVRKTDFDAKLISFNHKTTSNKTIYLEVKMDLKTYLLISQHLIRQN